MDTNDIIFNHKKYQYLTNIKMHSLFAISNTFYNTTVKEYKINIFWINTQCILKGL